MVRLGIRFADDTENLITDFLTILSGAAKDV